MGTSAYPERELKAGEVLFEQGAAPSAMYVLVRGKLAVIEDGVRIATVDAPGSFVGELGLLLGEPRVAAVKADTDARVQVIDSLERFFAEEPSRAVEVARTIARRLHAMDTRYVEMRRRYKQLGGRTADDEAGEDEPFGRLVRAWHARL